LKTGFESSYAPNINNSLVRIANVAKPIETTGLSKITRQDRARYVQISADISPGAGLGNVMDDINHYFATDYKLPQGMRHAFIGQAENMKEMGESMVMAMGLGILFIYLVLASLYESFAIPLTIDSHS
jgi:HAE1 family hydrophobic/amphiphilic exporter-1